MFLHKSSFIDLWPGTKYASEGYFSVFHAFPLFPWSKGPLEMDLKRNPVKKNWLLLRLLSGGKKFLTSKRRKIICLLSQDVRKSFLANESSITFSFIIRKPAAVMYAVLQQIL